MKKNLISGDGISWMQSITRGELHVGLLLIVSVIVIFSGCSRSTESGFVSYQRDIAPLLAEHCGRCHQHDGRGTQKSGFAMDTYEQLLKGTRIGAVIKPGAATASTLMSLVEGRADPKIRMPPDSHNPLAPEQISLIRRWIDEGAKNN